MAHLIGEVGCHPCAYRSPKDCNLVHFELCVRQHVIEDGVRIVDHLGFSADALEKVKAIARVLDTEHAEP